MRRGQAVDVEDPFGLTIGIILALTAAVLFAMALTVAWITVGAAAIAWFLWKRYRNSDAVRLRREIAEIRSLESAARYASTLVRDLPDREGFVDAVLFTIGEAAEEDGFPSPDRLEPKFREIAGTLFDDAGYGPIEDVGDDRLRDPDMRNAIRNRLNRQKRLYDQGVDGLNRLFSACVGGFSDYLSRLPQGAAGGALGGTGDPQETINVSTLDMLEKPKELVHNLLFAGFDDDAVLAAATEPLRDFARRRLAAIAGVPVHEVERSAKLILPADDAGAPEDVATRYLHGSPFLGLFEDRVPFVIPDDARFEHTHIVAGTGHGKTQLFQLLIKEDIDRAMRERRSVVVIDGQGDLINTIAHLPCFSPGGPMADQLVLVDPTDMAYPAALNMFDAGQDGYRNLSLADREMILNGTIELYSYLFGALLGAELTQKQEVIFRYLARLMLVIPGATIETLRELMENGEKFRPYVERLEGSARAFFETQFFDRHFDETKKQILRRLWGVLSNEALAQMFNHPRNKVDVFEAINAGKVVLINTAKDLLKSEGSAIFGRFFIAMTAQAALRRAVMARHNRTPTMVYIDEAHDYIDDRVEDLLNQARKFRVAMHLAHQNLGQLTPTQRATLASSTSVKMVGGASANDAKSYAPEMHCAAEAVLATRKRRGGTEFMVHVRNLTDAAIKVNVPFGVMERAGRMDEDEYRAVREANRQRYCAPRHSTLPENEATLEEQEASPPPRPSSLKDDQGFRLGEHEVL